MAKRKVLQVRLQTSLHIPLVGELGTSLPSSSKGLEGLDMNATPEGVSVKFSFRKINKEILIPYGNIVLADLAPEEPKK